MCQTTEHVDMKGIISTKFLIDLKKVFISANQRCAQKGFVAML